MIASRCALQLSRYLARRGTHRRGVCSHCRDPPGWNRVGPWSSGRGPRHRCVCRGLQPGPPALSAKAQEASQAAKAQGAEQWRRIARAPSRLAARPATNSPPTIKWIGASSPWNLTFVADLIGRRLDDLDESAHSRRGRSRADSILGVGDSYFASWSRPPASGRLAQCGTAARDDRRAIATSGGFGPSHDATRRLPGATGLAGPCSTTWPTACMSRIRTGDHPCRRSTDLWVHDPPQGPRASCAFC